MTRMRSSIPLVPLTALLLCCNAQHYCWPCALEAAVVGKDTHAASDAPSCYKWFLKYLNNVVVGAANTGPGYKNSTMNGTVLTESWDVAPNLMAAEGNECGTTLGDQSQKITHPMTPHQKKLVEARRRLPTGQMHQCPCALAGRAHIINGTVKYNDLTDFDAREAQWGKRLVAIAKGYANGGAEVLKKFWSSTEFETGNGNPSQKVFGMHAVGCPFHRSGPCTLQDVERGVARTWASNFSNGYQPLMDNNILLWTATLGPLLDAFARDSIDHYPMRWSATIEGVPTQVYSVLASPCGKILVEVAAVNSGGRPPSQFHLQHIPRAVFEKWNQPADQGQALLPLRISRAITAHKMDEVLDFYGAGPNVSLAKGLGFNTTVLADITHGSARAVTLMLSSTATVHLQLWVWDEPPPSSTIPFPTGPDFVEAVDSNQINGGQPAAAHLFCTEGEWTVSRYTRYISQVHTTVMTSPPEEYDIFQPPAGNPMDVFLDDHFAWDCTSPDCDMAVGGSSLYKFGSHIQWVYSPSLQLWTPYSHDPAGYGVQLHWFVSPTNFTPSGPIYPECFSTYANGTCYGAIAH